MVTDFLFHLGFIGFWTFIVKGMSTLFENLVCSHPKVKGHSVAANSSLHVGRHASK